MKITQVRCISLIGRPDSGTWMERFDHGTEQIHTLVEVVTDDGVTGVGSCFTSEPLVRGAVQLLEPLLVGESALDPAAVSERLHQATFWQGRGGTVAHAISGIDIALWDILGKVTRQPISRLLGGRHRDRVKAYASLLMDEPALMRDRLQAALEKGFRAVKIGWGPFGRVDDRLDEQIVATARDVLGDGVELMVDAGGSEELWPHGFKWALRAADMLASYGVQWFEEPLRPDDLEGYARLTEHSRLPISSGEVLTRRQSFLPWLDRRAVDYIQPDVTKVGGITEHHWIARYAYDRGILAVPHGWNTAIGLAADLQLAGAAINARWVEFKSPSQYIDDLFAEPLKLDADGCLDIPDRPGLGYDWNAEAIQRLSGGLTITAAG